ncbi:MAG: hypothetical protein NUW08_01600, partial [Candidatus Uhrbacteria bacterium]|nr:hypothetical protein [Candidatus Uhrbacteria bacterium]
MELRTESKEQRAVGRARSGWSFVLILLAGIGLGVFVGRATVGAPSVTVATTEQGRVIGLGQSAPASISSDVEFKVFWEAWQLLKDKYYQQPIEDKTLFYGAMSGLTNAFG